MNITDFTVVFICPDHNEKYHLRKQHMESLLNNIGFKKIVHHKSGTENYPSCLTIATVEILTKYIDEPVLIIEDDVEWTGQLKFDFDSSVDAIYFGISKCAGHPTKNIHLGDSKFINWNEKQVRVMNMLSAHAILYISKQYKKAIIDVLSPHLTDKYYNDVLMSRIQKDFIILACKKPFFYQSNKFNVADLESVTNFVIDSYN